jgi:hypothetical protein
MDAALSPTVERDCQPPKYEEDVPPPPYQPYDLPIYMGYHTFDDMIPFLHCEDPEPQDMSVVCFALGLLNAVLLETVSCLFS